MVRATYHEENTEETVVLLLVHRRNRELLSEWLSEHFSVQMPEEGELPETFDLCIIDLATLRHHHEALERQKKNAAPLFLPYLLVVRERERSHLTDDTWRLIDDSVVIPTSQAELGARVSTLLTARWQSLELQQIRQQEIEQERAFTESALRALPDVFYVFNDELELTRWNDRLATVSGYTDEELAGLSLEEIVAENDREVVVSSFQRVLSDGGTAQVEATFVAKNGLDVPYEFTAARLQNSGDERPAVVGMGRDVTDRALRRELTRQNERLEKFASIVSHDLRNPLTVANLNLDLGRDTGDDEYFEKVDRALGRMNDLIEDLLALARKGQVVGEVEPVSLSSAVKTSWSNVDSGTATLELVDSAVILADEPRLSDLLVNLFRNAVEHGSTSPQQAEDAVEHGSNGSQNESADTTEHDDGGSTIRVGLLDDDSGFFVEDDGVGIPEKEREKVFEYGYSTSEEGTGFGLAIVQSIAEAHGWTVSLTESDTGGARFEVRGIGFAAETANDEDATTGEPSGASVTAADESLEGETDGPR
ncbi:ATP-binding protein [Haloarchaeobius sp. DFWS5]|uniref:ATP-binding protein n=1 Tax=Haloarchaeobius sp. DFWS5 TaxID=3446114 RepID=UPI003EBB1C79